MSTSPAEARATIAIVILTFNEELNLPFALESVRGLASEVFIVDSGSTDKTVEIAESYGANVCTHAFTNQAAQFNWALDNLPITSEWVLRLDADEYLLPELRAEIIDRLQTLPDDVTGVFLNRRLIFLERWIRYGAYYPVWLLRIFRNGKARSELTEMDEHIVLSEGRSVQFKHDFCDHNRKGLSAWLRKHDGYAGRQARTIQRFRLDAEKGEVQPKFWGTPVEHKRWLKKNIYSAAPPFLRAFLFFAYRYVFRLGFLDGKQGLIFHFLHACWFMFYVDAIIFESELHKQND